MLGDLGHKLNFTLQKHITPFANKQRNNIIHISLSHRIFPGNSFISLLDFYIRATSFAV